MALQVTLVIKTFINYMIVSWCKGSFQSISVPPSILILVSLTSRSPIYNSYTFFGNPSIWSDLRSLPPVYL